MSTIVTPRGTSPRSAGAACIGVLALQGDFAAHLAVLDALGVEPREIRRPHALEDVDGLVIPGGESTTLLKHMAFEPEWWEAFARFRARGGAVLGTCAGLILLAREVRDPAQRSLGFLDVVVARNAYGRQRESFESRASWADGRPLDVVFIRAPRILAVGAGVEILATHAGEPVLVAEGRMLGATFHPELTGERALHELLVARCGIRTDA